MSQLSIMQSILLFLVRYITTYQQQQQSKTTNAFRNNKSQPHIYVTPHLGASDVCLPFEQSLHSHQTLGKRGSHDLQHFIFGRRICFAICFQKVIVSVFFLQKTGVSEELGVFERQWQIPRQKLLPVIRLFHICDPW